MIIQKITLILLFSAALNLSLQASLPQSSQELITQTGSYLNEQTVFLLPFREKELNNASQLVYSHQALSITLNTQWTPLTKNQIIFDMIFRSGKQVHKEFPILQFIKNLRI